jgi:CRISPR/Cas system CSM-associated protein Csm3 (group 7 of RAMP superfamily)
MTANDLSRLTDLEIRLYQLTTRSHLRVGAGEGAADVAVENPIIRALILDQKGQEKRVPYIPGSSLHGVVRAWVEKALRSETAPLTGVALKARVTALKPDDQEKLLDAARKETEEFLGHKLDDADALYEHWQVYHDPYICNPLSDVNKCERISLDENEPRAWKVNWWRELDVAPPCEVCRIFGYMGQRGRVKFTHAWPTTEQPPLDVITRVAINRLTGAADEGKLFDLEAIPPGVSFYFFVVMENMDGDKANFDLGIKALNLQLAGVGAHSTVGFGMVDVQRAFKATIKPQLFRRNVEADFIAPTLAGKDLKTLTDLDEEKVPRFFRALVAAQAKKQPFGALITFG